MVAAYNDAGAFEEVSVVNGVATIKGGRHVDHIASMIVARLCETMAKRFRNNVEPKPAAVKSCLFLFVRATIPNPVFDGQSKETLTTPVGKFGTGKLELSDKFFDRLAKTGIIDHLVAQAGALQAKELKKTDGKLRLRVNGIAKLDDANWAGGPKRSQCTLILTEGDSAKTMAIAGMSVVGRDKYGVFPLRGKLLNVKDVSVKRIADNEEIAHIKTILGLESGKKYATADDLRYGRVLIMTDQDVDGSHIKGLVFNLFESLWPSLLRVDGFIASMLTPIVKASRPGHPTLSFYSMQDYEAWVAKSPNLKHGVKYYKGLGTSTAAEAKEYFREMRLVNYRCVDPRCKEALDVAFNKKRSDDRKAWLSSYVKDDVIEYGKETTVVFSDFVNKDLVHFSVYDNLRSIPSVVDGLKPSQRKIMFACFSTSFAKDVKVFMLTARVAEMSAYHHGDASLSEAIVALAQDFVGSNNVNLLEPIGQFGTRRLGGKDSAGSRYICTKPAPITDKIFRPEDRPVLSYLTDDGMRVEPEFYVPVVPFALVNGAAGIGTGFSTNVPSYNPLAVTRLLIKNLDAGGDIGASFDGLEPWYRGFKGEIFAKGDDRFRFASRGRYQRAGQRSVRVTELPLFVWTESYKELLEDKIAAGELQSYDAHYTEDTVDFTLHFATKQALDDKSPAVLEDEYKLVSSDNKLTCTNMHLFNPAMQVKKYARIGEVVAEFARVRLDCYDRRLVHLLDKLGKENKLLSDKSRFIAEVIDDTLHVRGVPAAKVHADLVERGYAKVDGGFDHLLSLPIASLTRERRAKLDEEVKANVAMINYYRSTNSRAMWAKELRELEQALVTDGWYA